MQINNKKEGESFNHHFQVKTGAMSLLKYRAIEEIHFLASTISFYRTQQ